MARIEEQKNSFRCPKKTVFDKQKKKPEEYNSACSKQECGNSERIAICNREAALHSNSRTL
jgi:hypothetical protein